MVCRHPIAPFRTTELLKDLETSKKARWGPNLLWRTMPQEYDAIHSLTDSRIPPFVRDSINC